MNAARPLLMLAALLLASEARAVTIDWVTVGDEDNAADNTTYGAVDKEFRIGKYEVTIQQYTDFLNAVAQTDPYSLYSTFMASNLNIAGISRSGTSGGYSYSVIGPSGITPAGASSPGNRPITYVSWFDAARFANWMHNGQGAGSTEDGAYTLNGAISGIAPAKNTGAQFYIPTENEWYKAAYYSPVLNSGSGGYYTLATQYNGSLGNVLGGDANQANYNMYRFDFELAVWNDHYSVTQSGSYSSSQNYLTDVGAFSGSVSAYGTFDQSGNVSEWHDLTGTAGIYRGYRGGFWGVVNEYSVSSSSSAILSPRDEEGYIGFRLASPVPEPATWVMGLAGIACAGWGMRRRRLALTGERPPSTSRA